jgi:hypothetical protein
MNYACTYFTFYYSLLVIIVVVIISISLEAPLKDIL